MENTHICPKTHLPAFISVVAVRPVRRSASRLLGTLRGHGHQRQVQDLGRESVDLRILYAQALLNCCTNRNLLKVSRDTGSHVGRKIRAKSTENRRHATCRIGKEITL